MFLQENKHKMVHTKRLRHDQLLDFSEESLFEGTDRTYSKVYVELPYPTHRALNTSEDLVLKLLSEKNIYKDISNLRRRKYKHHDKKRIKREKYNQSKFINLPQYLVDFYNEKDPDPKFDSDYNYYYTGGNLEYFECFNNEYLIRPDINNNVLVHDIKDDDNNITFMDYKTDTTIFNIDSAKTTDGLFFVLREKYRITAVRCDDVNKVSMKYTHLHDWPVLDAKLNENTKLGIVFMNSRFTLKDIETNVSLLSYNNNLEGNVDQFQHFKFLDDDTVILMDRKKIKIFDTRTKTESMCFKPELLDCNALYNFTVLDNTLLVASRHYLLKTDLRSFEQFSHYSHSLSEAPCYMDYAFKDSDTYLCISGQNYDSRVLFTGHAPYSVPFKIPSLKRTLIETKLKYPSLVLEDHLESKLKYSLAGLRVVEVDNKISIFTSNCFGEIFKQNVYEKAQDNSEPIRRMYEWCGTIEKSEPNLHLTHFEELGDIRFSLNDTKIDKRKLKKYEKSGKEDEFLKKFGPLYSSKHVTSQLAKDFLSIWDESDEEEEIESLPKEETLDKVKSWIQTHDFDVNEKN